MVEYFRCPYCDDGKRGKRGKKLPRTVGSFRIKLLRESHLLLRCRKCGGVCKVRMIGKPLLYEDLSEEEKRAFPKNPWLIRPFGSGTHDQRTPERHSL